ncbi:MAG TPA: sigma 54-interacting transcriptional regulator [Anaeromyxobacteraceae bacterium]|nr:sigma 54-interacting transcriptional regulator [Anaeromyxobacteraceae bacterium]
MIVEEMQLETFKYLLLEMPQQRSVAGLMDLVTRRVGSMPDVALVRIWLMQPGDICSTCGEVAVCLERKRCLHLVSSYGQSLVDGRMWTRVDGAFKRFPLGIRKVGRIATNGGPLDIEQVDPNADWVADPPWIRSEHIVSFGGQPLVFRGEVLGVLALFARRALEASTISWLRMIADHLASALVNARSFEEIELLKRQVELENVYLRREVGDAFGRIIAQSPAMQSILTKVSQVAATDANILIMGESGTGKELVAREIHARSRRHTHPMIKINCAAIPRDLFESEFFGHAKGSFTGAARERYGLFQAADQGTLFLDEVSEIPLELQGKLLRVLQEREYRRVGEEQERRVDVRIIAAANRDLRRETQAGRFREDLYYRLQVFPFEIPPLRERKEEIPLLASYFLESIARRLNRRDLELLPEDLEMLCSYDWPGNCRELQNVIERAVITAQGSRLSIDISAELRSLPAPSGAKNGDHPIAAQPLAVEGGRPVLSDEEMRRFERDNTLAALRQCSWKIYGPGGASELLGVKPTTLVSRMKKMGLRPPDPTANPFKSASVPPVSGATAPPPSGER